MAHSPFCIPVTRILEAYGAEFERVQVPAWDRRELARLTGGAYYQVPILEHGSTIVYETAENPLALPHYLSKHFADGELFPEQHAGIQDIVINHIEEHLEGLGFPLSDPACVDAIEDIGERTMVIRHKERKMGAGCVEQWRANAASIAARFESALAPYEARLQNNDYLFGDRPVYADYALFGVLGNAQFSGDYTISFSLTKIKEWEKRISAFSKA